MKLKELDIRSAYLKVAAVTSSSEKEIFTIYVNPRSGWGSKRCRVGSFCYVYCSLFGTTKYLSPSDLAQFLCNIGIEDFTLMVDIARKAGWEDEHLKPFMEE